MKPLFILGEALTEIDAKFGSSFVSPGGIELLKQLSESGNITLTKFDQSMIQQYWNTRQGKCIDLIWRQHPEIYRTNVFNQHPSKNDIKWFCGGKNTALAGYGAIASSKYIREEFIFELERLQEEILTQDPNLIICLGNTALWALTGATGIMKIRGTLALSTHCVSGYKILPTYHPAAILRQYENRPTVIADLMKARDERLYPEIRKPAREIWIEPDLEDIRRFIQQHISGCRLLSVDIETAGGSVTCIGFAPSRDLAIVIPFVIEGRTNKHYWATEQDERECWSLVRGVLEDRMIPKVYQNGLYDIGFNWRAYRIKTFAAEEDTMLLSHALQPEALKGLGFLGSIFTNERSWKGMRKHTKTIKRGN
jgi:hypothetical protein